MASDKPWEVRKGVGMCKGRSGKGLVWKKERDWRNMRGNSQVGKDRQI